MDEEINVKDVLLFDIHINAFVIVGNVQMGHQVRVHYIDLFTLPSTYNFILDPSLYVHALNLIYFCVQKK